MFYGFKGTTNSFEVNSLTIIRFNNTCVEEYMSKLVTESDSNNKTYTEFKLRIEDDQGEGVLKIFTIFVIPAFVIFVILICCTMMCIKR